jgi:hypothetical protein
LTQEGEFTLSPREIEQEIKALKRHRKEVTSSADKARDFLIRAGILNKQGTKLSSSYRDSSD